MTIGYTTGVFDMFHVGHLNILRLAKAQCDFLIVGVSTDELVMHDKHKKPIIPFHDRCSIVEAIRYVDKVVPQLDKDKLAAWDRLHFDKMFVGSDWKGTEVWSKYEQQFSATGVEIVYFDYTEGISSTLLRTRITPPSDRNSQLVKGYTSGVFDMFHIGHLNILRQAKERCGYLEVGVSTDEVVESYKHHRPVVPFEQRIAIVEAISYVDKVVPQTTMNKMDMWQMLHFNVMFHGDEWKGTELYNKYEQQFAEVGVHIEYLPHTGGISSSMLRTIIDNKK